MHMARRVAAWVAWAVWICKPAIASGSPHAVTGYSLGERASARSFFVRPAGRTSTRCGAWLGGMRDLGGQRWKEANHLLGSYR